MRPSCGLSVIPWMRPQPVPEKVVIGFQLLSKTWALLSPMAVTMRRPSGMKTMSLVKPMPRPHWLSTAPVVPSIS